MVGMSAGGDEPELTADAGRSTARVWDSPLDHGPSTDWKCLWDYTVAQLFQQRVCYLELVLCGMYLNFYLAFLAWSGLTGVHFWCTQIKILSG